MRRLPIIPVFSMVLLLPIQGPRAYDAPRAPGQITIDGHLIDPGWALATWTEDFVNIQGDEAPAPSLQTRVKVLWDDEFLYIGAEMEEPHIWATLLDRDAIIYRDDDFEVFLDPDGDGLAYYEIEINAMGTVFDLFLNKPYNQGGRAEIGCDAPGLRSAVATMGTLNDPSDEDLGWSVEMAIPWVDLVPPSTEDPSLPVGKSSGLPKPGESWRINFSRVDWPLEVIEGSYQRAAVSTRENRHPEENWAWSPQGAINMHLPEMWGVVRFVFDPQNPLFNQCP